MGRAALLAAMAVLLGGAWIWAGWVWVSLGDAEISGHGIAALVLGVVFSLIVGCGLMALVFFSSRRGYDERVDHGQDGPPV